MTLGRAASEGGVPLLQDDPLLGVSVGRGEGFLLAYVRYERIECSCLDRLSERSTMAG